MRLGIHRSEIWLALAVFLGAAYFYGGASWNQNARLDAIFTFVEPGPHRWTFRLDPFLPDPMMGVNTGDWTRVGDHYYANKAPGTILIGVLAYFPLYTVERAIGADLNQPALEHLNAYLINLLVTVVPVAIAIAGWSRLLARRAGPMAGVGLALLTFFGTALLPYSTQLWGHPTAAAFAMLAVIAFEASRSGGRHLATATGVFIGFAMLSDFLVLPILLALTVACLRLGRRHLLWFAIGGSGPALLLLLYQWYCFGSPFHLPTEGTNPMFVDETRTLGLFGWPSGVALFQMTIGPFRGLLIQMPLLLGALVGFVRWRRRDPGDAMLWLCGGSFLATLVWVSTFNGWHGGATVSARYLIVVLPLAALALRELPGDRAGRRLLAVLAVPSLLMMLAIAAVSPLVTEWHLNPLFGEVLPRFLSATLHPHALPVRLQGVHPEFRAWQEWSGWNWGDLLGLTGSIRLVPWLVLVSVTSALSCISARSRVRGDGRSAAGTPRGNLQASEP
jgi:hypothetical protein